MSEFSTPQGRKKRRPRVPPPPTYIEGWGEGQTYGPPWRNPFPGGWGYPWWRFERPFDRPYELVSPEWSSRPIPTYRKPSNLFWEPQGGQSFCSTSGAGSTISSSSGQVGLPREKIRIEEVIDSDAQPESVSSNLNTSFRGMLFLLSVRYSKYLTWYFPFLCTVGLYPMCLRPSFVTIVMRY